MSSEDMDGGAARRSATINLRVETETRDLIDSAASLLGKSRTEFMIESARRDAVDVLLDQCLFQLDAAQHAAFTAALDQPPAPGDRLQALMRKPPLWSAIPNGGSRPSEKDDAEPKI